MSTRPLIMASEGLPGFGLKAQAFPSRVTEAPGDRLVLRRTYRSLNNKLFTPSLQPEV